MESSLSIANSIRERLTNPFIFSFLIAWFFFNWKLTIALFWLDSNEIRIAGYPTLLSLVGTELEKGPTWYVPAIIALVVTPFIPILRETYSAINSGISRLGLYLFIKISKESSVPMSRFLQLREEYLFKADQLDKVIKNEGVFQGKYMELERDSAMWKESHYILSESTRQEFMQGKWELRYTNQIDRRVNFRINGSNFEVIEIKADNSKHVRLNCNFTFFYRDIRPNEKIVFQIRGNDDQPLLTYLFNKLGINTYEGIENFRDPVTLEKVSE